MAAATFAGSLAFCIFVGILALVKAASRPAMIASSTGFEMTANQPRVDVHLYDINTDQLNSQDWHFTNRTSLFKDQISRGNASLQLQGVKVQDRGLYQCYTSTDSYEKESFINLTVDAPVNKVDIQQDGNRITCSSEGIYPEPELTWSTNPPSNVTFKNSTTVQQTEQQLYNINSSLIVSDGVTGLDYRCTVSSDRSRRTATLFKLTLISKVDIQQEGNRITCSSEGIYPEPELTWSTNPPSSLSPDKPTVQQTEQQLYNINSSLVVSDGVTGLDYSCTVSSDRSRRTATLFKPNSQQFSDSDTETTISCTSTNTPINGLSLTWRFNHSQIILNQTRANVSYVVSDEWKQHVKSVSESGSLTLQDLSSKQEGLYTCELSNDEETNVTSTVLRIEKSPGILTIILPVFFGIAVVVGILAILLYCCWKKKKGEQENRQRQATNGGTHQETELENLTGINEATPHQNCRNPTADHLL